MFGAVAKERHAQAWGDDHRHEHHHSVVYCSQQHYWSKVANISRDEFGVYLSAKAHTTYTDMYGCIKEPSAKKPLGELDAEVYMSPLHPRGEELATLLEAGLNSEGCRRGTSALLSGGRAIEF